MGVKFDRVEWHSGYQAEEKPIAVYIDGNRLEITSILWQKRIQEKTTGKIKEVFKCELADGRQVRIVKTLDEETAK
ncbi:MAG: hypothetical protein PHQ48_06310 [Acidobacteriota bacterium]|nr:hypothetical protein [Acidobacteriota bacterium]